MPFIFVFVLVATTLVGIAVWCFASRALCVITEETALAESDNPANLRLAIKQHQMGKYAGPFRDNAMTEFANKKQF